jgi:hypothetical protein
MYWKDARKERAKFSGGSKDLCDPSEVYWWEADWEWLEELRGELVFRAVILTLLLPRPSLCEGLIKKMNGWFWPFVWRNMEPADLVTYWVVGPSRMNDVEFGLWFASYCHSVTLGGVREDIVLGKFGLVWFGVIFPKLQTEWFGFCDNFPNLNLNR